MNQATPPRSLDLVKSDIKERIEIGQIIGKYAKLIKEPGGFKACCPLPGHKEKTPSFHLDTRQKLFFCYGCQRGGDIFTFLNLVEGLTFMEALRELGQQVGVEIPEYRRPATNAAAGGVGEAPPQGASTWKAEKSHREAGIELMDRACKYYGRVLLEQAAPGAGEALSYLQKRGISESEMADLGLGWAPSGSPLTTKIDPQQATLAEETGLVRRYDARAYDFFQERLMIPIADHRGRVVAFSGRTLKPVDAKNPKYKNSPESEWFKKKAVLYGLDRAARLIREHGFVAVVEGYFDQWALLRHEIPAVAVMGTALTPEHLDLLSRYTRQVVMVLDTDSAGVGATIKSLPVLVQHGCEAKVFSNLRGKDPADWLAESKLSSDDVRKQIRSATEAMQWWVERIIQDGLKSHLDRTQIFRRLVEPWSCVRRDDHRRLLAGVIGVTLMDAGSDENAAAREVIGFLDRLLKENPPERKAEARAEARSMDFESTDSVPVRAPAPRPMQSQREKLAQELFTYWVRNFEALRSVALESWAPELVGTPGQALVGRWEQAPIDRSELSALAEDPSLPEESRRWVFAALVGANPLGDKDESSNILSSFEELRRSVSRERLRTEMARLQNELRKANSDIDRASELLGELQRVRLSLENT